MKSVYWTALAPLLAVAASVGRWLAQGSGNVYTDADKQRYVPDPDLGWRLTESGPVWLGLEVIGLCAGVAGAVLVGAWWLRRRGSESRRLRAGLAVVGALPLAIPLWAFASGFGPSGARDVLPAQGFATARPGDVSGALPKLAAGTYQVVEHTGTRVTATVTAGGETFEARFSGAATGTLRVDPRDFSQPVSAEISVASATVDTGIELRSKHAREELQTETYPQVRFVIERIVGVTQQDDSSVAFAAVGTLELLGKTHEVHVQGVLRAPDAAGRERLGLTGRDVLLVQAKTSVSIAQSAIENDGTFERDELPIDVSLVLARPPNS